MSAPAAASDVNVTLPDGKVLGLTRGATGADVAARIGPGLAKAALAVEVDGKLWDLSRPLEGDAKLRIITRKDPETLDLIRHDTAHVLAMAVQALYPGTQITIGPNVEDGFYYDFVRATPFTPDDLPKIEAKMREIVAANLPTRREVWDRDEAIKHFESIGETYKAEIIRDLPGGDAITVYFHGDWHDLCRGPHFTSTGKVGQGFKLTKIAGAYWRGDARNAQLQRIYGTAWRDEKELEAYLKRIEEAEKRDHRKLGREMDLFHLQPEAMGSVFWHPKGYMIWRQLEAYIRRRQDADGYIEVKTPQLLSSKFWEQSGHWSKFRENMFVVPDEIPSTDEAAPIITGEAELMAIKPMNCPAHVQIFKQHTRSYRDLPMRMAEFGICHRNEAHGALHGLLRVRQMTQDDAHIFCREDQIMDETRRFLQLFKRVYADFGLTEMSYRLATRPEVRAGSDETWDRAEKSLAAALEATGMEFAIAPGEGAFYGPKLEFHLTDAIGRSWQCGTFQLDHVLPERLDASYIGEDGNRHRPVMLHRAVFGSFERFLGVLIEHYAGKFPLWLAPVQAVVATIVSDADSYAQEALQALKDAGIRAEIDLRNEKINYKVREHSLAKVPYLLIAGRREADNKTLTVRRLGIEAQESLALTDAIHMLKAEAVPPDLKV